MAGELLLGGGGGQTPIGYHKLQAFGSREPKDAVHRVDGLERYKLRGVLRCGEIL
mgnify:CR=1 FL=1